MSAERKLVRCGSCPAVVWFVETVNGKMAPLNADADPGGNVMIGWDGRARFQQSRFRQCRVCGCTATDACRVVDLLGPDRGCAWVEQDLCEACVGKPMVRYISHYATCPDAKKYGSKVRQRALVDAALERFEQRREAGLTVSQELKARRHHPRR